MSTDDFFIGNNESLQECNFLTSIYKSQIVLTLGGALSSLSYLYIFYMYFIMKSPILMRHPTTLAVYRSMFEFIFVQQYLWLPSLNSYAFYNTADLEIGKCRATSTAAVLAFLSQFSLLGGEVWFFVISWDLRLAYTNPFASFKESRKYYTVLVFFTATLSSIILMLFGPTKYGISPEGIIWIQNRRDDYNGTHPNLTKFVVFYFWMFCIYVYCVWAIWRLIIRMRKGFAETLGAKLSIIHRARTYVISYTIYWGILLLLEFVAYAFNESPVYRYLTTAVAYGFAFRGVWSLGFILYTNWSDLSWAVLSPFSSKYRRNLVENCVKEGLLLKPHLNSALRAEILYFTTQGIMFAAQECDKHVHDQSESSRDTNGTEIRSANTQRKSYTMERLSVTASATAELLAGFVGRGSVSVPDNNVRHNSFVFKDVMPLSAHSSQMQDIHSTRGSEDFLPILTNRYTDIVKFNEQQMLAVAAEEEDAVDDEAERLGLLDALDNNDPTDDIETGANSRNDSNKSSNESNKLPNQATVRRSWAKETSNTGTSQKRSTRPFSFTLNPFYRERYASNNEKQSVELPETRNSMATTEESKSGKKSMNPLKPIQINKFFENPKKNGKLESHPSTEEKRDSSSSATSKETVKWRDTMDLQFKLKRGNSKSPAESNESSQSPLQRLRDRFRSKDRPLASNDSSIDRNSDHNAVPQGERPRASTETIQYLIRSFTQAASDVAAAAAKVVANQDYDEFKFKDFNPMQFARIRAMSGISAKEYAESFLTTTKESFSEGRSGAFLFFSSNERFIAKTTTKDEIVVLLRILHNYEDYLSKNPHSLLIKFLGAHRITMYGQNIYFVVMENVFPATALSERYDLKGSWVKRHRLAASAAMKKSSANNAKHKYHIRRRENLKDLGSAPLLFDNDIQQKITLLPKVTAALTEQIAHDITFLKEQGLMDYSLLVGVKRQRFEVVKDGSDSIGISNEDLASDNPFQIRPDGGIRAAIVEGPGMFYFGIIDVLQEWNWSKKLERFFKVNILGYDGDGLSAIEPVAYASRFLNGAVLDFFDGVDDDSDAKKDLLYATKAVAIRRQYRRSNKGSIINMSTFMPSFSSGTGSAPLPDVLEKPMSNGIPIQNRRNTAMTTASSISHTSSEGTSDSKGFNDGNPSQSALTYVYGDDKTFHKFVDKPRQRAPSFMLGGEGRRGSKAVIEGLSHSPYDHSTSVGVGNPILTNLGTKLNGFDMSEEAEKELYESRDTVRVIDDENKFN